jgi:hypothetical protein
MAVHGYQIVSKPATWLVWCPDESDMTLQCESPRPRTPPSHRWFVREVERSCQHLPEGSYGRRNRQAIAARETRVASRLRAVEQAYRTATQHDTAPKLKEPSRTPRSPELQAASQIDLEAEP